MPIQLPTEPVDLFRVEWWTLNHVRFALERRHAIYHVNTPWADVVPDDRRHGVAFVDDFAIYADGRLDGRGDWKWMRRRMAGNDVLASASEATAALRTALSSRIGYLEKESARLRALLALAETGTD